MVKNLPANAGDVGLIPGSGRSPGEGNGSHSRILVWEIPWTEDPDSLQGLKEFDAAEHTCFTLILSSIYSPFSIMLAYLSF